MYVENVPPSELNDGILLAFKESVVWLNFYPKDLLWKFNTDDVSGNFLFVLWKLKITQRVRMKIAELSYLTTSITRKNITAIPDFFFQKELFSTFCFNIINSTRNI